jgi:hypothetical protein
MDRPAKNLSGLTEIGVFADEWNRFNDDNLASGPSDRIPRIGSGWRR